jgi:hypothetical protein
MMTTRKQLQKKKARELKGKARAAARRHKLEQIKRDERKGAKLNRRFREKIVPFIKDPEKKKAIEEKSNQKSIEKLEKNMQILKALEEEHLREAEERRKINESLEAEGHITLQDKVKALEEKARASLDEEQAASGGIDLTAETPS